MSFKVALSFHLNQYFDYLRDHGFDVTKVDMQRNDEDETIEKMKGFDAICAMGETYSARVLDALKPELKVLCRHGIGYDKVDINHAAELGICCCNTPGTMSTGVAETALLLMLECTRQFYLKNMELRKGIWDRGQALQELTGKTIGLLGFGNIARMTAKRLSGFEVNVIAYDPYVKQELFDELGVKRVTEEELLKESDFVSIHIPHSAETTKYCNKEFFEKMKPSAFFINTARGKIVDEAALVEALKSKTIAGAGLDVFWDEPSSPDNELFHMDNVFCTPHIATNTETCTTAGFDGVIKVFNEFKEGKVPYSCLNPDYVNHLS